MGQRVAHSIELLRLRLRLRERAVVKTAWCVASPLRMKKEKKEKKELRLPPTMMSKMSKRLRERACLLLHAGDCWQPAARPMSLLAIA
jgi:hypothetical protein